MWYVNHLPIKTLFIHSVFKLCSIQPHWKKCTLISLVYNLSHVLPTSRGRIFCKTKDSIKLNPTVYSKSSSWWLRSIRNLFPTDILSWASISGYNNLHNIIIQYSLCIRHNILSLVYAHNSKVSSFPGIPDLRSILLFYFKFMADFYEVIHFLCLVF